MKIGFIGLGNMGSAILGGIIKQGSVKPEDVIVTDKAPVAVQKAVDMLRVKAQGSQKKPVRWCCMMQADGIPMWSDFWR